MTQQQSAEETARAPVERTRAEPRRRQHRSRPPGRPRAGRRRRRPPVHGPRQGGALRARAARRARHGRRVPAVCAGRRHSARVGAGGGEPAAQGGGRRRQRRHPGHRPGRARALCQCRLSRLVEAADPTTCGRSSACSSAIPACRKRSTACSRRRAKAAAARRRCASARTRASRRAGCVSACARSARQARARMTVWSIADVTRDLERQENVFQELQHAIDYLDHAPAGFFSAEADGNIVYLNATLANWLDHDLAQVGSGGLKLDDIVSGEGAALLTTLAAVPGEVKTEVLDIDLKTRGGPHRAGAAVPQGRLRRRRHARRLAHAGAQPRPRRRHRSAARRRSALHALLPEHADGDRHRSTSRAGSRAPTRRSRGCSSRCSRARPPAEARSILAVVAERDRAALEAAIRQAADGQGDIAPVDAALAGPGERFARFFVTAVEEEDDATARPRSSTRSRPPSSARSRTRSTSRRRWRPSASSPAASRTTSTTCSAPS